MADMEHIKILDKGIDMWNNWMREMYYKDNNYTFKADLSGINLKGRRFRGATFPNVNFSGTNLKDACLIEANLFGADLQEVNLTNADLGSAILDFADLRNAKLRGATLDFTSFRSTKLKNADFTKAMFQLTVVVDTDLSEAIGLDTIRHAGPSSIGIDTISQSKGNIPEIFLRGVGTPDQLIVYARSLFADAIEFYSCFISYSSRNKDFAERLYTDLQSKGVRCWFAPENLKIGDKFRQRIDESIRVYEKLLVILSENSISSPWVEDEVESALERERKENRQVLFPIRIDDSVLESDKAWAAGLRRLRHIGDFRDWKQHDSYKKSFERLLRDLNTSSSR